MLSGIMITHTLFTCACLSLGVVSFENFVQIYMHNGYLLIIYQSDHEHRNWWQLKNTFKSCNKQNLHFLRCNGTALKRGLVFLQGFSEKVPSRTQCLHYFKVMQMGLVNVLCLQRSTRDFFARLCFCQRVLILKKQ